MSAIANLSDEECYLAALLQDPSGIEQAEWMKHDPQSSHGCYRAWDFQHPLYRCDEMYQIDWCFPEGTMVLTDRGSIPIESVTTEDKVLTHTGQWQRVTNVFDNGIKEVKKYEQFGSSLETTDNHELMVRLHRRKTGVSAPSWTAVGDIADWSHDRHYQIASPAKFDPTELPGIVDRYSPGVLNDLTEEHFDQEDFWWLAGLYLAEGSLSSSYGKGGKVNRVTFSVHEDEVKEIEKKLISCNFNYSVTYLRKYDISKAASIVVNSITMANWLFELIGRGSSTKFVHPSVLSHPLRKSFLEGAMFGDGHFRNDRCEYVTTSKGLAYDILNLARSLEMPASVSKSREAGTNVFPGGRVCQTREAYVVVITLCAGQKTRVSFEDEWVYTRLGRPSSSRFSRVFDLEVEEDHSYTANGFIVHNCSRAIGKTMGIVLRVSVFMLNFPGQECLILAPSEVHLQPILDKLEYEIKNTRLLSEMLLTGRSDGIKHRPFQIQFRNGSKIVGRIPGMDGKNTKGIHSVQIETDESQEFEDNTWVEVLESLERTNPGAVWRVHGVSRGSRDKFYTFTMSEDPNLPFFVHRYPAMYRPTWSDKERREKIALYGGSSTGVDYLRNIFGDHGDVSNRLFVISKLMQCVRIQENEWAHEYNKNVFKEIKLTDEFLRSSRVPIETHLNMPAIHLSEEYRGYYGGMDVGFTSDPSELLIFGELPMPNGELLLRLLLRLQMMRVGADDQASAIRHLFNFYGDRFKRFSMDRSGVGLPLWQLLDPTAMNSYSTSSLTPEHIYNRISGFHFSEKVAVEFDHRPMERDEEPEDLAFKKNVVEHAIDQCRLLMDYTPPRLELPYNVEMLKEFQGQEIQMVKDDKGNTGVMKRLKPGGLHTTDAFLMTVVGRSLIPMEVALKKPPRKPVRTLFG